MAKTFVQKMTLRLIGVVGAAIFSSFFALTYSVPGWIEDFGANYIQSKVEGRIDTSIDAIRPPESKNALGKLAQSMFEMNEEKIEQAKSNLKNKVHEQLAASLAAIRDLSCECRQIFANSVETKFKTDITLFQAANDRITDFIHSSYMDVATELKRDIRIFTAGNAAVFFLLLLVSFTKPKAIAHLFLPGLLLVISTLICSYFYIFETNWLLTIINGSYLGFAYYGWLGCVFLILCDIVFNRARVTTTIVNAISSAIGSAFSLVPC